MTRFLFPSILLAITALLFWAYIDPQYQIVKGLRAESQSYEEALASFREIQSVRDELTSRYNTFSTDDVTRLERLLPDTVDNVRLVLDINNIAGRYGLVIKDVRLSSLAKDPNKLGPENQEYGTLVLQFSVTAGYSNFVAFMKDLEDSLRVVDVSGISFKTAESQLADYDVAVQTYWLK
ncbi:type 4a pilus biogenesis protein PilO [Candidatus Parcubacteria bacterium]|nr:type 4a pilus biogenesis protein PilO [Candidatus Parcubacteria bacterium]